VVPGNGERRTIGIVRPAASVPQDGNATTAERWRGLFDDLGFEVFLEESWDGRPCDVLIGMHARKSHASIVRFHRAHPAVPLIVCGTGTDLYTDVMPGEKDEVRESLGLAARIVVLQRLAVDQLPPELRERARVIYQSVSRSLTPVEKPTERFQVAFPANVRPVKDPLTAARAAALLPEDSRIVVVHAGSAIDDGLTGELEHAAAECPGFEMLGPLPHGEALALIRSSHLLLSTSRHEGGANVLSEALAEDVPIVTTHIPGALGMLGETYPGTFPVGDAEALAALLVRAESDAAFYDELRDACRDQAWLTDPRTEKECWGRLLDEVLA